ncbi:hypothetical protein [Streptomyces sp. NPDC050504]|uniref:hypothetical protein n=1 Tax=Streptomyces sp. NPDC050504 TaxID=3365618 RepID=UPI0037879153
MSAESSTTAAERGPLPPRSGWGLRCQFFLQWLYLPPVLLCVFAASLFSGAGAGGSLRGRGAEIPEDPFGDGLPLSRRQYRLELRGSREEWRVRAGFALRRAIALGPSAPGEPLFLPACAYRGLGPEGVHELAVPLGWRVDWPRTRYGPGKAVYLSPAEPSSPSSRT